jgi:hypothetical protein
MSTTYPMSKELRLLNLICVIAALGFLAMIVVTALTTEELLSTDTLFIMTVSLVMALLFAVNPLLYLKSEGKLPVPFIKKSSAPTPGQISSKTPPLLDAKGRAMPPDVRTIVAKMGQSKVKES